MNIKKCKQNSDFLFKKDDQKILVECKELESLPIDNIVGTLFLT